MLGLCDGLKCSMLIEFTFHDVKYLGMSLLDCLKDFHNWWFSFSICAFKYAKFLRIIVFIVYFIIFFHNYVECEENAWIFQLPYNCPSYIAQITQFGLFWLKSPRIILR